MRALFYLMVVVLAAVGLAVLYHHDPGYVLLARSGLTVEMSLVVFLALLLILFGALYFLLRFGLTLWHLRGNLARWRRRRTQELARRATRRGMNALIEQNWPLAERELARGAQDGDMTLASYLLAAQAAQQQGSVERRDRWLTQADQVGEGAIAVGLTQAQLQLEQGQLELALATLSHLRSLSPKNLPVLRLLARLYQQLASWEELLDVARAIRRLRGEGEQAEQLECQALHELFREAVVAGAVDRLRSLWGELAKPLRQGPKLISAYARGLVQLGQRGEAEGLLREVLKRRWEPELVRLYGQIEGEDPVRQLTQAEGWLTEHEQDPALLFALGCIAERQQLWGKARAYFEASAGQAPERETYRCLGELLERLGEHDAARDCFYRGLTQGESRSPVQLLPAPS